jgi:hypothetical protein
MGESRSEGVAVGVGGANVTNKPTRRPGLRELALEHRVFFCAVLFLAALASFAVVWWLMGEEAK